jgi:hypothetical protein
VANALFFVCAFLVPAILPAQTSSGALRGYVLDESGQPLAGASVRARNDETGFQRGMLTEEGGFYNLAGLPPGVYSVEYSHPSYGAQTQDVQIQIGQDLRADVLLFREAIEVPGIAAVLQTERIIEPTTTEVATNITQAQIENLPLLNRNFLEFAKLAPGVTPTPGGESIRAGGLPAEQINLFIDGASFKNDVLTQGIVGQDAVNQGNPFPQNAVAEFRVITQNYKAEYQKAAGAVITAKTKSGTNQWEGSAFFLGQNENFIGKDPFQACDAPGQAADCQEVDVRDIGRQQFGLTLGGPIVEDRAFIFGSYEGNYRDVPQNIKTVSAADIARLPASVAGIPVQSQVEQLQGTSSNQELRSNLFFGKATFQPSERHRFEGSLHIRDEFEVRNFGGDQPRSRAEDFNNDVYTGIGRWEYSRDRIFNEALVEWQRFQWHPVPLNVDEPGLLFEGIGFWLGGACCEQEFVQDRIGLRDDITYTLPEWNGSHVLKAGAYVDFLDYDARKQILGNPQFFFRQDEDFMIPFRAEVGFGDPDLSSSNEELGLYVQDDWSPTDRLMLNLGIRWDYETNMLNNDWVTPDSVRQEVATFLTPEQQADFFTDGDDRGGYKKMFQPRVGFSYDLTGDTSTVLFGGGGLFFDRVFYDFGLDEAWRLKWTIIRFRFSEEGGPDPGGSPTIAWQDQFLSRQGLTALAAQRLPGGKPEVFLLENDTKPPKAWQWTFGVRQAIGDLMASVNYTGVRGYNQPTWMFGNRRPNGSCCLDTPRFGNLLISTDEGRTWYDALMIQLGKPYTEASNWGAQLAYTLSESQQDFQGRFTLDILSPEQFEKFPSDSDERHRLVVNGIVGLPWDFLLSGIGTLASARPISAFVGGDPNNNTLFDDFPPGERRNSRRPEDGEFKRIDLRLEKEFPFLRPGQSVGLVVELFNVFDWENFTCFEQFFGDFNRETGEIVQSPSQAERHGTAAFCNVGDAPSRRLQLGVDYEF